MRLLCTAAAFLGLSTLTALAQSQDELREIHKEVIRQFLDSQNSEQMAPAELPPGLPFLLPQKKGEDIRFEFQARMAASGHGIVLDIEGNRVELKADEIFALQQEMWEAAQKDAEEFRLVEFQGELAEKAFGQMSEISLLIASLAEFTDSDENSQFLLRHYQIRALAFQMRPEARSVYLWRTDYLTGALESIELERIDPEVRRVGRLLEEWVRDFGPVLRLTTQYMRDCANAGVPVPPDFALTGSQWTRQGALTINMLRLFERADLYTWADPNRRGACVALPRYAASAPARLTGIICQGAQTGNACVWDSLWAGSGQRVRWEDGETMPINQLRSRTSLAPCSDCHTGNNVFLVAPDDAAWCKVMRGGAQGAICGTMDGPNSGNFTLQVEGAVRQVNAGGVMQSRFQWVDPGPVGGNWNNQAGPGCGGACHLGGDLNLVNRAANRQPPVPTQRMPPACGTNCN